MTKKKNVRIRCLDCEYCGCIIPSTPQHEALSTSYICKFEKPDDIKFFDPVKGEKSYKDYAFCLNKNKKCDCKDFKEKQTDVITEPKWEKKSLWKKLFGCV